MPKNRTETPCTEIGTRVIEHPRRVKNPVTEEYEDLTKLSEDGYKRRFLALLHASNSPDHVDLGSSPVLAFDRDRWELTDGPEGQIVLKKRESETAFDAMVMD